ncbi:polysaccharide deacetylase family protein [Bacteroidia bacterium]|nr:polysaccharide deacetylase family protein [Bacteroidia bacterium]
MRIYKMPSWLPKLFKNYTWKINTTEPIIYLTFDDGPDPKPTRFVLDTLLQYHAKATFFCVGENIQKHRKIAQEIINQGHVLANHTMNHLKGWQTSHDDYVKNTNKCQETLEEYSTSSLFRPPYGRITKRQTKSLKESGYEIIMWDLISYDYDDKIDINQALKQLIRNSKPGSIVVFHDSSKAWKQLKQMLPKYMHALSNQGYSFESIPNRH